MTCCLLKLVVMVLLYHLVFNSTYCMLMLRNNIHIIDSQNEVNIEALAKCTFIEEDWKRL